MSNIPARGLIRLIALVGSAKANTFGRVFAISPDPTKTMRYRGVHVARVLTIGEIVP